jgi:hypothetical protein
LSFGKHIISLKSVFFFDEANTRLAQLSDSDASETAETVEADTTNNLLSDVPAEDVVAEADSTELSLLDQVAAEGEDRKGCKF